MTLPQDVIAGWEAAIKANEAHIQRIEELVRGGYIKQELSGIKVLGAENEMYRLLIAHTREKFGL